MLWQTREGRVLDLRTMDHDHLMNSIRMVIRQCAQPINLAHLNGCRRNVSLAEWRKLLKGVQLWNETEPLIRLHNHPPFVALMYELRSRYMFVEKRRYELLLGHLKSYAEEFCVNELFDLSGSGTWTLSCRSDSRWRRSASPGLIVGGYVLPIECVIAMRSMGNEIPLDLVYHAAWREHKMSVLYRDLLRLSGQEVPVKRRSHKKMSVCYTGLLLKLFGGMGPLLSKHFGKTADYYPWEIEPEELGHPQDLWGW